MDEGLLFVNPSTPARALGAVCGDDIVVERYGGRVDCGKSCDENSVFAVASLSKLVVAMAAMTSVSRGELDLDRDVKEYGLVLPGLRTGVSMRMLLSHRSGLMDSEDALDAFCTQGSDFEGPLERFVIKRLTQVQWSSERSPAPYHYSNLGFTIAALVLEKVAGGTSFWKLAKDRVFTPLGMVHSSFLLRETRADASATIASPHPYGRRCDHYGVAEWPAAGLRSTLHDMLLFMREFTSESPKVLTVEQIPQVLPPSFVGGLGWWGKDNRFRNCFPGIQLEDRWEHGGLMSGIRSYAYLWPRERLAIVILQNGEERFHQQICLKLKEQDFDSKKKRESNDAIFFDK